MDDTGIVCLSDVESFRLVPVCVDLGRERVDRYTTDAGASRS